MILDINNELDPLKYDEMPPATSMIESVRSCGYDLNTAIADIIDNSISANARNINVELQWNKGDPYVCILDNGTGMTDGELAKNIMLGSTPPSEKRNKNDLGRFGLGMKTASFSMARELNVFTKTNSSKLSFRQWDLDKIEETKKWLVFKEFPSWYDELNDQIKIKNQGTLIYWKKCDRFGKYASSEKTLKSTAVELVNYLGTIFSRFFVGKDNIKIYVNSLLVEGWNPIPEKSRSLGIQTYSNFKVHPFVLPHRSQFSNPDDFDNASGINGWNSQQGFYIYRENRLIVNGTWLGLKRLKNDEHTKLARIIIDIDSELDHIWQLDILKSKASVPSGKIRDNLESIARKTRSAAEEVYRHRGKTISRSVGASKSFMWNIVVKDDGTKNFTINRDFPLIKSIKENYIGNKKDINHLITLIERLLPTESIQLEENKGTLTASVWTFEQCLEQANLSIFLKEKNGIPRKTAIRELFKTEMFSDFKDELIKEFNL
jgi:hypothetical protein